MNELALLQHYQLVGAMLFGIGLIGFVARRNMIVMFLSAEMMLQGVSLSLVAWGRFHNDFGGQVLVLFIIAVAACEAAVALALILMLWRRSGKSGHRRLARTRRSRRRALRRRRAAGRARRAARLADATPGGHSAGDRPRPEPIIATMFDVSTLLILIPGVPLLATLVTAALGRRVLRPAEPRAGDRRDRDLVGRQPAADRASRPGRATAERWPPLDGTRGSDRLRADRDALDLGRGRSSRASGVDDARRLPHRRHAPRRRPDGDHARRGQLRLAGGGGLLDRLHGRRPGLLAVLQLHRPVRLLDADARLGEQLRAACTCFGKRSGCAAIC